MQSLITGFTAYLQFEKRYSVKTVQAYQTDLEQFFLFVNAQFGSPAIELITHIHIRSWLAQINELNWSTRSINRKISTLKSFYKYLLRKQLVSRSPMGKIISPKNPKRLPGFVQEPAMMQVLEHASFTDDFKGQTDRLMLELLYQTGMRRAELLGLRLSSFDQHTHTLKVLGKGNKERIIPLQKILCEQIARYITDRAALESISHQQLLSLPNGKPLYEKYIYLTVKKYLGTATTLQKKSPHVLRHTFATHILNQGGDLNAVKELLGHASLAATQVYTHNTIEKLKEIYEKTHPRA